MPIDLQDSVVYGPIHSRRLGHSLGINLLPLSWKLCDFDCVYCQYGWTPQTPGREKIKRVGELEPLIEEAFKGFREAHETIDCITLAGNGEPALHPDFMEIIRATKRLRDIYFPEARVGILTDASLIHKPKVREALLELDDRYLKLDVASKEDLLAINRPRAIGAGRGDQAADGRLDSPPVGDFDWDRFVEALRQFPDKVIQSLFVTGSYDNTSDAQIEKWIRLVAYVQPREVQVYSIDRSTADPGLRKVSPAKLHQIALKLEQATGIEAYVFE